MADTMKGNRALVVGGYGGIGSTICHQLAESGADIVVAGRDERQAVEQAKQLAEYGAHATGAHIDITSASSVQDTVVEAATRMSGIDVLINCASRLETIPADQFPEQQWREVIETNLTGAFLLSREVGRNMIEAGEAGRIVHLSSVRGSSGAPRGFAAYGASKAGLNLLVRQLATEWGRHGITVNAVAPGFVRTDFVEQASQDESFLRMVRQRIPLGRFAEPAEVAGAVRYLVSPSARFVTGQILFVDGGVTASQ